MTDTLRSTGCGGTGRIYMVCVLEVPQCIHDYTLGTTGTIDSCQWCAVSCLLVIYSSVAKQDKVSLD